MFTKLLLDALEILMAYANAGESPVIQTALRASTTLSKIRMHRLRFLGAMEFHMDFHRPDRAIATLL
jgi:hypothetical protein